MTSCAWHETFLSAMLDGRGAPGRRAGGLRRLLPLHHRHAAAADDERPIGHDTHERDRAGRPARPEPHRRPRPAPRHRVARLRADAGDRRWRRQRAHRADDAGLPRARHDASRRRASCCWRCRACARPTSRWRRTSRSTAPASGQPIEGVRNIIAIASNKGGVGKSTVVDEPRRRAGVARRAASG